MNVQIPQFPQFPLTLITRLHLSLSNSESFTFQSKPAISQSRNLDNHHISIWISRHYLNNLTQHVQRDAENDGKNRRWFAIFGETFRKEMICNILGNIPQELSVILCCLDSPDNRRMRHSVLWWMYLVNQGDGTMFLITHVMLLW